MPRKRWRGRAPRRFPWSKAGSRTLYPTFRPATRIALLRLDADWFDSTLICLNHLYDHMAPGGRIVIDDYYAWERLLPGRTRVPGGAKFAATDYAKRRQRLRAAGAECPTKTRGATIGTPAAETAALAAEVLSPLTGSADVTLHRRIGCDELIAAWRAHYELDVSPELCGHREIQLYECNQSGLRFFRPADVAGSADFYAALERFEWYYMPRKWEHDIALRDLPECAKVLEVGCGRGAFLTRLGHEKGCQAKGLELNQRGVAAARAAGLSVAGTDVREYAAQHTGEFDAACAFQVLEHVPDVSGFLTALVRLVRPGGRLILAVPNHDSFLAQARDMLLDQPPHHMTQWRARVLACLPTLLPLRLLRIVGEPLASYHVDLYLHVREGCARGGSLLRRLQKRLLRQWARPLLLRCTPVRRWIRGQTLYACFARLDGPAVERGGPAMTAQATIPGPVGARRDAAPDLALLNLGCGSHFHPSWTNVDLVPRVEGVRRCDVRAGLPFPAQVFDAVYHAHVLEHLPRDGALPLLRECLRVLRPDGILRVVVPDLERVAQLYLDALGRAVAGDPGGRPALRVDDARVV